ncbi:MAG: pyrroline-5-carboxylate reductase dimerization domain-containing protein, partial [Nitrosomonadales bacterium]|nr:pyrroline-5-carboxylate reductase dimerization domain-containing protein [Nitrosomonadales bacterium]
SNVSAVQRQQAEALLKAVGHTLWVEDETKMDAITAISGSGPAYVFYLIEAMQDAAVALGFSPEQARMLSLQTFAGASQLAIQGEDSVEELRHKVTSKGGTTERAILSMEAAEIKRIIAEAANAAAHRSKELGDQLGAN